MPKKTAPETETQDEPSATHRPVTISGLVFQSPNRYAEGHVLTSGEASAMNQLLSENLRNNFATQVKKAQTEGEAAIAALPTAFTSYAEGYEFSGKRRASAGVDPIEREARKLAKADLLAALRGKGVKISDYPEDLLEEKVKTLVASRPKYMETAKARLDLLNKLASDSMDVLDEAAE